jgi:hypothetical protein
MEKKITHHSVFKFKNTDHIGTAGAEDDHEYLPECFIDTGDFSVIKDLEDHRQILLGRAGSGKSALIKKMLWTFEDQVVEIEPENLAITYISNSTILQFFSEIGVNLDPFFKLLWRHIFTVEILTRHFTVHNSSKSISFSERLSQLFSGASKKDKEMQEAILYLESWGKNFWEETEFRVKEITQKLKNTLEGEAAAELGIPRAKIKASLKKGKIVSEEQKHDLITRGQNIVARAQIAHLNKVIKLIDTVLSDKQKQYYVVIDGLDENWVEEKLRYKLIMALILTAKDFFKVKNAKIIIALTQVHHDIKPT